MLASYANDIWTATATQSTRITNAKAYADTLYSSNIQPKHKTENLDGTIECYACNQTLNIPM